MFFTDNQKVTFRRTEDGYLVAEAPVARTGIQIYSNSEMGLMGDGKVRVYRPEQEVFSKDSLATYAHRPVTLGHVGMITADNWKQHAIGQTGSEIMRDGDKVSVPMMIMDSDAIARIESKMTRELSMGYACDLVFEDGVTPDGEPYDAIQKGLRMNHLAIVASARGGPSLKIGDEKGAQDMADAIKTRTIVVDGLPIECTDASAAVIEKLQGQIAKITTDAATASTDAETDLAKRDVRITELEAAQVSDEDLNKLVTARADLVSKAKTLVDGDLDIAGKSEAEIRKAVVAAKLGDAKIEGRGDAYIEVMFDALLEAGSAGEKSNDPFAAVMQDGKLAKTPGAWGDKIFKSAGVKMKKEA